MHARFFSLARSAAICLTFVSSALAADPAWWNANSTGIYVTGSSHTPGENYVPANIGQLKLVATQAKKHLDLFLPNNSYRQAVEANLAQFAPANGTSYTSDELVANYSPVNIGQIKAVAEPFYAWLISAGYNVRSNLIARGFPNHWPFLRPWNPATPAEDNYAIANIGQLKAVFSFDAAGDFINTGGIWTDTDADGLADWWELQYFESLSFSGGSVVPGSGGLTYQQLYTWNIELSQSSTVGDGIPDSWKQSHGIDTNDPNAANDDPDHDGLTNADEYDAQLDPQNQDGDSDGILDGQDLYPRDKDLSAPQNVLIVVPDLQREAQLTSPNYSRVDFTRIKLKWNTSANGPDGYIIERRLNSDIWQTLEPTSQREYDDQQLLANVNYQYRITAYKDIPGGRMLSKPAVIDHQLPFILSIDRKIASAGAAAYSTGSTKEDVIASLVYPQEWREDWWSGENQEGLGHEYGSMFSFSPEFLASAWRVGTRKLDEPANLGVSKSRYRFRISPSAPTRLIWKVIFVPKSNSGWEHIQQIEQKTWDVLPGQTVSQEYEFTKSVEVDRDGIYVLVIQPVHLSVSGVAEAGKNKIEDDANPGKVVLINDSDADNDGIPDYADGYDLSPQLAADDACSGASFSPLALLAYCPYPQQAKIRFIYDASNPRQVTATPGNPFQLPPTGKLRLWKKDASQSRNSLPVESGGDFIKPDTDYTLADLGLALNSFPKFFVEALETSGEVSDLPIKVEIDPTGSLGYIWSDQLRFTATRIERQTHRFDETEFKPNIVFDRANLRHYYENIGLHGEPAPPFAITEINIYDPRGSRLNKVSFGGSAAGSLALTRRDGHWKSQQAVAIKPNTASSQPLPQIQVPIANPEAPIEYAGVNAKERLIPCDIVPDLNRDGKIDNLDQGKITKDRPWRWWCNDDHDISDTSANGEETTGPADSADTEIKCERDLEDFFPLHLYIGGLQDAIKAGKIKVGLAWRNVTGDPSIRVYRAAEPDGGTKYLTAENGEYFAALQTAVPFKTAIGSAIDKTNTTYVFPSGQDGLFGSTGSGIPAFDVDHPTRNLIVEGVSEGKGQLVMTFYKEDGTTPIGEGGGVWLDIKNVRKMYRRGQINQDAPSIPNPWVNDNPPALTWTWDLSDGVPEMDPNAEKKTIAFVHGWRMSPADYLTWSDTTFKRLYHLGYKGSFYSFRWPTYHGGNGGNTPIDIFVPGSSTYNPSEYRAWLSGPALAAFINGLPNPDNRFLIAHSMGNVVAGAALRNGMQVKRYEMCNAAMAAMAYDPSIVDDNYTTPDTDSDLGTRNTYGLASKFNFPNIPASTTIINFSLPNDSALGQWSANNQFFKPQTFANGQEYAYHSEAAVGDKLRYNLDSVNNYRVVTSVREAMGYLTQSRSRAAGAKQSTGGSVSSFVNMGAGGFGFGTEHSAEWNRSIQKTYPFWKEVLTQFQIDVGSH